MTGGVDFSRAQNTFCVRRQGCQFVILLPRSRVFLILTLIPTPPFAVRYGFVLSGIIFVACNAMNSVKRFMSCRRVF
jgi:hypothetical protein